jgi:hypothetical protein
MVPFSTLTLVAAAGALLATTIKAACEAGVAAEANWAAVTLAAMSNTPWFSTISRAGTGALAALLTALMTNAGWPWTPPSAPEPPLPGADPWFVMAGGAPAAAALEEPVPAVSPASDDGPAGGPALANCPAGDVRLVGGPGFEGPAISADPGAVGVLLFEAPPIGGTPTLDAPAVDDRPAPAGELPLEANPPLDARPAGL